MTTADRATGVQVPIVRTTSGRRSRSVRCTSLWRRAACSALIVTVLSFSTAYAQQEGASPGAQDTSAWPAPATVKLACSQRRQDCAGPFCGPQSYPVLTRSRSLQPAVGPGSHWLRAAMRPFKTVRMVVYRGGRGHSSAPAWRRPRCSSSSVTRRTRARTTSGCYRGPPHHERNVAPKGTPDSHSEGLVACLCHRLFTVTSLQCNGIARVS